MMRVAHLLVEVDILVYDGRRKINTDFNRKENFIHCKRICSETSGMLSATLKALKKQTSDLKGLVGADLSACGLQTVHCICLWICFLMKWHAVVWVMRLSLKPCSYPVMYTLNGGANDVQGVAYALATAVCYVRQLDNATSIFIPLLRA